MVYSLSFIFHLVCFLIRVGDNSHLLSPSWTHEMNTNNLKARTNSNKIHLKCAQSRKQTIVCDFMAHPIFSHKEIYIRPWRLFKVLCVCVCVCSGGMLFHLYYCSARNGNIYCSLRWKFIKKLVSQHRLISLPWKSPIRQTNGWICSVFISAVVERKWTHFPGTWFTIFLLSLSFSRCHPIIVCNEIFWLKIQK